MLFAAACVLLGACAAPESSGTETGDTQPATTTGTPTESVAPADNNPDATDGPTSSEPAPTEAPAPPPAASGGPQRPGDAEGPFAVTKVVDGDTIHIARNGDDTLRLIGMDTPETVDPRKPVQCFGREASAKAHELLDNQQVWLSFDPSQGRTDKYGRTLAFVWLADGSLYAWRMINDGYAHQYTYDLPYTYRDDLVAAERSAREAGRGLWSPSSCNGDTTQAAGGGAAPSAPATPPTTVASGPYAGTCDPSYPTVCIPPAPPDLDCGDIPDRRFTVLAPDPHRFDRDRNGIGCESG
jgi:micrococcal nuclease